MVIFMGLLNDLFPGVDPPRKRDIAFEEVSGWAGARWLRWSAWPSLEGIQTHAATTAPNQHCVFHPPTHPDPPNPTLHTKVIRATAVEMKLAPDDDFVLRIVQLSELLAIRHCVFLMGPTGCGRTECYRVRMYAAAGRMQVFLF